MMKALYVFTLMAATLVYSTDTAAEENKSNCLSFGMGMSVYPSAKCGTIYPTGTFSLEYTRELNRNWLVSGKINYDSWLYETLPAENYPLIAGGSKYDMTDVLQKDVRPEIVGRYCLTAGRWKFMPGISAGLDIGFDSSKRMYLKDYGSNDIVLMTNSLDNSVTPMLGASLKIAFRLSRKFSLALEGSVKQYFGTKTATTKITDPYNPDIIIQTYGAKTRNWCAVPVSIILDWHF